MGIEGLSRSILAGAKQEADQVIHSAEKEAANVLQAEKARRALLLKGVEDEAHKSLAETRGERLAWARLERKRILADAKERAINASLDELISQMDAFRKSKEYKEFVKSSSDQSITELGSKAVVHVLKGEKSLVGKTTAKVVEDLEGLGGVLVESPGREVCINSTVEALLELRREALRKHIAKELF